MESKTPTVPMATQVAARPQGHLMVPLVPTTTAQPYTPPPEVKEEHPGTGSFAANWRNPYLPYFDQGTDYPDDDDDSFRAPEQRQTHLTALEELQSKNSGFDISPTNEHGEDNYFKPGWFSGKVLKKKAHDDVIQKFRAFQDTAHPVIKRQTAAALAMQKIGRGNIARKQNEKKKRQQQKTEKIKKQVDKLLPHFDYAGGKRKHRRTKRHKKRKKKRRKKTRKHKRRKRRKTRKR
jgi:hypothetical protein